MYGLNPPQFQNLALNKPATGTSPCSSTQGPANAFNGSVTGGGDDKWCSHDPAPMLQVDLGATYNVAHFVVRHAGAGGENPEYDTRDFNIQVSVDGTNFTTVTTVTGNASDVTIHDIATTPARFVRLNVVTATSNGDTAARIYEFEVYGTGGGGGGAEAEEAQAARREQAAAAPPAVVLWVAVAPTSGGASGSGGVGSTNWRCASQRRGAPLQFRPRSGQGRQRQRLRWQYR